MQDMVGDGESESTSMGSCDLSNCKYTHGCGIAVQSTVFTHSVCSVPIGKRDRGIVCWLFT